MVSGFLCPSAGDLRLKVTLEQRAGAPDGGTSLSTSYVTVATVRARAKVLFGQHRVDGVQTEEKPTHIFTIRYRSDYRNWRWLTHDGRRFAIRRVMNPEETKVWLELVCEEVEDL